MISRTSLFWMGVWVLASGCAEPQDVPGDEEGEAGALEAQRDAAGAVFDHSGAGARLRVPLSRPHLDPPCGVELSALAARVGVGAFGDIAFGPKCTLLVAGAQENRLYRFDTETSMIEVVAGDFPDADTVVGAAYVPGLDYTFVATALGEGQGSLFRIDDQGYTKLVLEEPSSTMIRALAVAPAEWGRYGGHVVLVTDETVMAVDPDSYEATVIAKIPGLLTDLSFSLAGTLYVSDYSEGAVHVVHPEGEYKTIARDLVGVDGVAAARTDDFVYVSEARAGTISIVDVASGAHKPIADVPLGPGPGVTGMLVDRTGALIHTWLQGEARVVDSLFW